MGEIIFDLGNKERNEVAGRKAKTLLNTEENKMCDWDSKDGAYETVYEVMTYIKGKKDLPIDMLLKLRGVLKFIEYQFEGKWEEGKTLADVYDEEYNETQLGIEDRE